MGGADGAAVQGVRERGARQERVHARQAALPVQGLRAELHRHAAPWHAAAGQGRGGAAVPERAVDEPHRRAARRVDALGAGLDRALRRRVRPEARARGPRRRGRAGRDVAFPKKSPTSSGCGRLGIVLRGASSTGSWAVVTRPLASGYSNAWSAGTLASTARTTGRPTPS